MTKEQLAAEATRIGESEAINLALDRMRLDALDALATADPEDAAGIRTLQSTVKCVDAFRGELSAMILNGTPRTKNIGIA